MHSESNLHIYFSQESAAMLPLYPSCSHIRTNSWETHCRITANCESVIYSKIFIKSSLYVHVSHIPLSILTFCLNPELLQSTYRVICLTSFPLMMFSSLLDVPKQSRLWCLFLANKVSIYCSQGLVTQNMKHMQCFIRWKYAIMILFQRGVGRSTWKLLKLLQMRILLQ